MRMHAKRMQNYDWWQAGEAAGVAPTEWEAVSYGRLHADAWIAEGVDPSVAVLRGVKAMYRLGYDDCRDVVVNRGSRGTSFATSDTSVSVSVGFDSGWFELLHVAASTVGLSDAQRRMVVLYGLGWSRAEAAGLVGLSVRTGQRRLAEAFEVLRKELA